ncbi:MAG: hypothetical protein JW787_02865 [Sedimentisphaerales bacterium]|nr:hypothetical protein [Sedimentisphaerales bacterium]
MRICTEYDHARGQYTPRRPASGVKGLYINEHADITAPQRLRREGGMYAALYKKT